MAAEPGKGAVLTITTTSSDPLLEERADWVGPAYGYFLQVLAFICMGMALVYWAQLLGMTTDQARRFDLLDTNPRIVYTILVVTLPFAALGLWFKSSWGIVVWIGCSVLQIAMHALWADIYGEFRLRLAYIALCATILLAFNIWFVLRWRTDRLTRY